ncbi:MAG: hypothetical protein AB9919_02595 [Geobacteraceae bacterium]
MFLAFSIPVTVSAGTSNSVPPQQDLVKGNGEFAVRLYLNLSAKEGNLFFSPLELTAWKKKKMRSMTQINIGGSTHGDGRTAGSGK